MRATDIGTYMATNEASARVNDAYAQQVMQLKSQQSQLENVQDQYQMQGEHMRDLADRQDKAAYYNNLAQDWINIANAMQSAGINLNQSQLNKDLQALLPQLNEYGIGIKMIDGEYQVVQKNKK